MSPLFALLIVFISSSVQAKGLNSTQLAGAPLDLSLKHLREFDESVMSGQKAFVSLRSDIAFSPRQFPQASPLGTLYGYPFGQHISFASTLDGERNKPLLGTYYAYSRQGWQKNDFAFVSDDGEGHQYRSSHMGGLYLSSYYPGEWLASLGYAYSNDQRLAYDAAPNEESHRIFTNLQLYNFQMSFMGLKKIELARFYIYGEERKYDYRMKDTWKIYLPRVAFEYRRDQDNWATRIEQNLYNRTFYTHNKFDLSNGDWVSSDLVVYFDPSRFFWAGFSLIKDQDRVLWGWNLQLALFEVGYQWAEDLVEGMPWRGSARVGINISIATLLNKTFRAPSSSINLKEEVSKK